MSRHILIVAGSAQGIESSSFEIAQEIADCFDQSSSQVRDLSNGLKSIDREWVTANKQGILVITLGGVPVDSSVDFATPYLRQVLSFIGVTNVQTVSADQQLTTGDAMERARLQVSRLRTTNSSEPMTNHE